ncbi:hypothetical protein [Streptomyces sp. c-19]|uniref:hypothetical protein n=1 Tax=Streptomyces sp. c-19 TaxID=2789275 RepID=UPI0039808CB1
MGCEWSPASAGSAPVGDFDEPAAVIDHLCAAAEERAVPVELSADLAQLCERELRILAGCRPTGYRWATRHAEPRR